MLTLAYVVAFRQEETFDEAPGTTGGRCSDCGAVLRLSPETVGLLRKHPAATLLCSSCALKREVHKTCRLGASLAYQTGRRVYFRDN